MKAFAEGNVWSGKVFKKEEYYAIFIDCGEWSRGKGKINNLGE